MDKTPPEGDISEEFRRLGENLKATLQAAWHSDKSQKLQAEIRGGLAGLEYSLRDAADEFNAAEAGQRIRADVEDLSERVRSGQVEADLRRDLLSVLKTINAELSKTHSAGSAPGEPKE